MLNVNSGCDQAHIQHKPSLLSYNDRSYLFGEVTKRFSLASDLVCTRGETGILRFRRTKAVLVDKEANLHLSIQIVEIVSR